MNIVTTLILIALLQLAASLHDWTLTEQAIHAAIKEGHFSGCVLGIATNNSTLLTKAYGTIGPKRGFYSPAVTADMKFDLGFLTGPVALNAALMDLFERATILPNNKISFLYSDFNNNGKKLVTIENLLEHNSGTTLKTQDSQLPSPQRFPAHQLS